MPMRRYAEFRTTGIVEHTDVIERIGTTEPEKKFNVFFCSTPDNNYILQESNYN